MGDSIHIIKVEDSTSSASTKTESLDQISKTLDQQGKFIQDTMGAAAEKIAASVSKGSGPITQELTKVLTDVVKQLTNEALSSRTPITIQQVQSAMIQQGKSHNLADTVINSSEIAQKIKTDIDKNLTPHIIEALNSAKTGVISAQNALQTVGSMATHTNNIIANMGKGGDKGEVVKSLWEVVRGLQKVITNFDTSMRSTKEVAQSSGTVYRNIKQYGKVEKSDEEVLSVLKAKQKEVIAKTTELYKTTVIPTKIETEVTYKTNIDKVNKEIEKLDSRNIGIGVNFDTAESEAILNRKIATIAANNASVYNKHINPILNSPSTISSISGVKSYNNNVSSMANIVKINMGDLTQSLIKLQQQIVDSLDKELKNATGGSEGWAIKRKGGETAQQLFTPVEGAISGNSRQLKLDLVDVKKLKTLTGSKDDNPVELINQYTKNQINSILKGTNKADYSKKIGEWLKVASDQQIEAFSAIGTPNIARDLKHIRGSYKGNNVSNEMTKAIESLFNTAAGGPSLEEGFKKTYATFEANKKIADAQLIKSLSLPAASVSTSGNISFETISGSKRALPKFATLETGLEQMIKNIYNDKSKGEAVNAAIRRRINEEKYIEKINEIGYRPYGGGLAKAKSLSKDLLVQAVNTDAIKNPDEYIQSGYMRAASLKGMELSAGKPMETRLKAVQELQGKVAQVLNGFKNQSFGANIDKVITQMETAGINAYDFSRGLDKLKFENTYDVISKAIGGQNGPIAKVGKRPNFNAPIRDYEAAIANVEQILPLIEPGRPRRGMYQENVVHMLTKQGDLFKNFDVKSPSAQKEYLKDINLRLHEMTTMSNDLRSLSRDIGTKVKSGSSDEWTTYTKDRLQESINNIGIPEGTPVLSTVGLPESVAGASIERLRPSKDKDTGGLNSLNALHFRVSGGNLRTLSPFGEQFQQWGRNITPTTNAITSVSKDTGTKLSAAGLKLGNFTRSAYPSLITEQENDVINSGRYGHQGYGYNALTELRSNSGTFEDQMEISGKLADALTSITKTLIKPSSGGKVGSKDITQALASKIGISDIEAGKLLKTGGKFEDRVGNVNDTIQNVLGISDKYKGRADAAIISEVEKAMTVVRGQDVEVQSAKIAEVFLNYYGRKLNTRYGSKGVSITPTSTSGLLSNLQRFGDKNIKILTPSEREKSGLGTAITPISLGKMVSDLIITKSGKPSKLQGDLETSGNKFMMDIFKDPNIVSEKEATTNKNLYDKAIKVLSKKGIKFGETSDIEKIKLLRDAHEKAGFKNFEEHPIDVRISAHGLAKRGLQTEVMEAIMNNLAGTGGESTTVMRTVLPTNAYEHLLGDESNAGAMAKYSEALGYGSNLSGTLGSSEREQARKVLEEESFKKLSKGKANLSEADMKKFKAQAHRMSSLEATSNYYSDILDPMSTSNQTRKGLVGNKFFSIAEEPHLNPEWQEGEIESGLKGEKLNIPAYAAYSTIFGSDSAMMKELKKYSSSDSAEHWEYIKALQTLNKDNPELKRRLIGNIPTKTLSDIPKDFTNSTGNISDFKGTILDTEKFPTAFNLKLPSTSLSQKGKYEDFYVPAAIARGTHQEDLIGGERAPKPLSRRLLQVINAAHRLEAVSYNPFDLEDQLSQKNNELSSLNPEDSKSIGLNTQIKDLHNKLNFTYSNYSNAAPTTVKRNIVGATKRITANKPQESEKIIDDLTNLLSKNTKADSIWTGEFSSSNSVSEFEAFDSFRKGVMNKEGSPLQTKYKRIAGRLNDMLTGPDENTLKKATEDIESRYNMGQYGEIGSEVALNKKSYYTQLNKNRGNTETIVDKNFRLGTGAELAAKTAIKTNTSYDALYDKQVAELSRAKVDYYDELANSVLGKRGSLAEVFFSRKMPAITAKATVASVDRTKELKEFQKDLRAIGNSYDDVIEDKGTLFSVADDISNLNKEHKNKISKLRKAGMPVLTQDEIGIPSEQAEKIPVEFEKKYITSKKDKVGKTSGSLYDLLKYKEGVLSKANELRGDPTQTKQASEMEKYVENELVPYVESVRFPFTGTSSVQPYKATLIDNPKAKHTITAPGIPEMDMDSFQKSVSQVESVIEKLSEKRSKLNETDIDERERLNAVIKELTESISKVIPKYIAHQQKLDFDGDNLELHSAATVEARKDIKKHFDSMSQDQLSTETAWKNAFTYDATLSGKTSSPNVMADMAASYEKKFPAEKGFDFMKKPFLSEELEYLSPQDKLSLLSERGKASPHKVATSVLRDFGNLSDKQLDIIENHLNDAMENTKKTTEGFEDPKKYSDMERAKIGSSAVYSHIDSALAKAGAPAYNKDILNMGVNKKVFEDKYQDAIVAQIFKLNTGMDTEALYRINRLGETDVGFGNGIIGKGLDTTSGEFSKRWPKDIEAYNKQPGKEFHTMINEMLRFGLQKGMDVKHAGQSPVAGEMATYLSKGKEGALELYNQVMTDDSYKEFKEFSDVNAKAIRGRMEQLPTSGIRSNLDKLLEAKGETFDFKSLEGKKAPEVRKEMIDKVVDLAGVKGFLVEVSKQIEDAAIKDLTESLPNMPTKQRQGIAKNRTDYDAVAREYILNAQKGKGIDINGVITKNESPLYSMRTSSATPSQIARTYRTPWDEELSLSADETNGLSEDYAERLRGATGTAMVMGKHFSDSDRTMGKGAYGDMLQGAIQNLQDNINKANTITKGIQYSPIGSSDELASRLEGTNLLSSFKDVIGDYESFVKPANSKKPADINKDAMIKMKEMAREWSDIGGIPGMADEEKSDVTKDIQANLFKHSSELASKYTDRSNFKSDDEYEESFQDLNEKLFSAFNERAQTLKQMDRAFQAMQIKGKEGTVLSAMLPGRETSMSDLPSLPFSAEDINAEESPLTKRPEIQSRSGRRNLPTGDIESLNATSRVEQYSTEVPESLRINDESSEPNKVGELPLMYDSGKGGEGLPSGNVGIPSGTPIPVFLVGIADGILKGLNVEGLAQSYGSGTSTEMPSGNTVGGTLDSLGGSRLKTEMDEKRATANAEQRARTQAMLNQYESPTKKAVTGSELEDTHAALRIMHNQAKTAWTEKGLNYDVDLSKFPTEIQGALESIKNTGNAGQGIKFTDLIDKFKNSNDTDKLSFKDQIDAWRMYRIALGDYLLKKADEAKNEVEVLEKDSNKGAETTDAYNRYLAAVNSMRNEVRRTAGKTTDIYTMDRKYISPDSAKQAGVHLSTEELIAKANAPIGNDPRLESVFHSLVNDTKPGSEKMMSPIFKVRNALDSLSSVDKDMVELMNDTELAERSVKNFKNAWDFATILDDVTKLKAAMQAYSKFNLEEDTTVTQRRNIQETIKLLDQFESTYSKLNPQEQRKDRGWGDPGIVNVLPWLEPKQQKALHMRNIEAAHKYYEKPFDEGGAEIGESFTYNSKIMDSSGHVVKNVATDFHKYGEYVNEAGQQVGAFTVKQRDLTEAMAGGNRTLEAAFLRVMRWTVASKTVYGFIDGLRNSIATIAEVETGISKIRMLLNPMDSNFNKIQDTAIGYAKQYGVPTKNVLTSMYTYAQQGLPQEEVIERTKSSTLATNVTTLGAKESAEALTAAVRAYGKETQSTMRYIDAWSSVETKHAITAADLANAIKKTSAAAKNAGISFDQLNGIVASIGSVTRQSGNEIGTSLKFMFSRLGTPKPATELAKIGISTMLPSGDVKGGFAILNELAGAWTTLSNAQKLSVAQAIGGTRQYNSMLVLMDNWKEALKAVHDSMNSKGAAEEKNLELMKTYEKQLQQTKEAFTGLQVSLGKAFLPMAKGGLHAVKFIVEGATAIPDAIKASAVGLALLLTYVAKGKSLIDGFFNAYKVGGSIFGDFGTQISRGFKQFGYEAFGIGKDKVGYDKDLMGLHRIGKPEKDEFGNTIQHQTLQSFNSSLGKTLFLLTEAGRAFNVFAGSVGKGAGDIGETAGGYLTSFGESISGIASMSQATKKGMPFVRHVKSSMAGGSTFGESVGSFSAERGLTGEAVKAAFGGGAKEALKMVGKIAGTAALVGTEVIGTGAELTGMALTGASKYVGGKSRNFMVDYANENTSLTKSLLPMLLGGAAISAPLKGVYDYYKEVTSSPLQYQKDIRNQQRHDETRLKVIRDMGSSYSNMGDEVKNINADLSPSVKVKKQELGTYHSPLLNIINVQKEAIDFSNKLSDSNINLIAGYDKLGNAVLRVTDNFKGYVKSMESAKLKDIAEKDVKIVDKYATSLTETGGPEKWKYELKKLTKEIPVFGDLVSEPINISPAKQMEVATTKINKLFAAKSKYPATMAFDKDIQKAQESLKGIRDEFNSTYNSLKESIASISTEGMSNKEIEDIFTRKALKKSFTLMVEVEPKFRLKELSNTKSEDLMGAEIMRHIFPHKSSIIGDTGSLSIANAEEAGFKSKTDKIASGDLVTFMDSAAKKYKIAGNQAIISLKETTDGVFKWVATYFNTKTLKVEEVAFNKDMQKLVDRIIPTQDIETAVKDRIDTLNEFVVGAGAGIRGVSEKEFKKSFNLGERFFNELPTTTLIQSQQGYNPMTNKYGQSSFQEGWTKDIKEYYFKPMTDYSDKLAQLERLSIGGEGNGDNNEFNISKGLSDELVKLQKILENNQVVLQYRAVFADLTKSIEEGTRSLRENVNVEKEMLGVRKGVSGYMKGVPSGLENMELGMERYVDLTPRQRALSNSPTFVKNASDYKLLQMQKEGSENQLSNVFKAKEALDSLKQMYAQTGTSMKPEELANYSQKIAIAGDKDKVELLIATHNVAKNTADTVYKLDELIDAVSKGVISDTKVDKIIKERGANLSADDTLNYMNKIAKKRDKAIKSGDVDAEMASNKALDMLSINLVKSQGFQKAYSEVKSDGGRFSEKEFSQRIVSTVGSKSFTDELRSKIPQSNPWYYLGLGTDRKDIDKKLTKLDTIRETNNQEPLISSKDMAGAAAATAIYMSFNNSNTNKAVKALQGRMSVINEQIRNATEVQGKSEKDIRPLVVEREATKKELDKELSNQKFYQLTEAFTETAVGTLEFAKAMGLSEKTVKALGVTAATTYTSLKYASMVLGKEMPESAKNFESALNKVISKEAGDKSASLGEKADLKKAGEKMTKDYESKLKEGVTGINFKETKTKVEGLNKEELNKQFTQEMEDFKKQSTAEKTYRSGTDYNKERNIYADLRQKHLQEETDLLKSGKGFASEEYKEMLRKHEAEQFESLKDVPKSVRDDLVKQYPMNQPLRGNAYSGTMAGVYKDNIGKRSEQIGNEIDRYKDEERYRNMQMAATVAATTFARYKAEEEEDKTRGATLNNNAKRESKEFNDLIRKNPKEAGRVIDSIYAEQKETVPDKVKTKDKLLVQNTNAEYDKLTNNMTQVSDKLKKSHDHIINDLNDMASKMAKIELAESFKKQMEEMKRSISNFDLIQKSKDQINIGSQREDYTTTIVGAIVGELTGGTIGTIIGSHLGGLVSPATGYAKFPIEGGLRGDQYNPLPLKLGIRNVQDLTPEQRMLNKDIQSPYIRNVMDTVGNSIQTVYNKLFVNLPKSIGGMGKVFGSIMEDIGPKTFGQSNYKLFNDLESKNNEYSITEKVYNEKLQRKVEIENQSKLSSAEKEELKQLETVIPKLKDKLVEIANETGKVSQSLRMKRIKEEIAGEVQNRDINAEVKIYGERMTTKQTKGLGMFRNESNLINFDFKDFPTLASKNATETAYRNALLSGNKDMTSKIENLQDNTKRRDSKISTLNEQNEKLEQAKQNYAYAKSPDQKKEYANEIEQRTFKIIMVKRDLDELTEKVNKSRDETILYINTAGEAFKMIREASLKTLSNIEKTQFENRYSQQNILNPELRGLPSSVQLPKTSLEYDPMQALYVNSNVHQKKMIDTYTTILPNLMESKKALYSGYIEKKNTAFEAIQGGDKSEATLALYDFYSKKSADMGKSMDETAEETRKFGEAIRIGTDSAEIGNNAIKRFAEVISKQSIEMSKSFIQFQEKLDRLPGGNSPEAPQPVSARAEYEMMMSGVTKGNTPDGNWANKWNVQKGHTLFELGQGNKSPEERGNLVQDLMFNERDRKLEMGRYLDTKQKGFYIEQTNAALGMHNDIEKLIQNPNLSKQDRKKALELDSQLSGALNRSADIIPITQKRQEVSDELKKGTISQSKYDDINKNLDAMEGEGKTKVFRGLNMEKLQEIMGGFNAIGNKNLDSLASNDAKYLSAGTDKVVNELVKHTGLLATLVDKSGGSSKDLLGSFDSSKESSNGKVPTYNYGAGTYSASILETDGAFNRAKVIAKKAIDANNKKNIFMRSSSDEDSIAINSYYGGYISGPGSSQSDSIPAMLSNGEYVIKANSVDKIGKDRLDYLNKNGQLPKFSEGGKVVASNWYDKEENIKKFNGEKKYFKNNPNDKEHVYKYLHIPEPITAEAQSMYYSPEALSLMTKHELEKTLNAGHIEKVPKLQSINKLLPPTPISDKMYTFDFSNKGTSIIDKTDNKTSLYPYTNTDTYHSTSTKNNSYDMVMGHDNGQEITKYRTKDGNWKFTDDPNVAILDGYKNKKQSSSLSAGELINNFNYEENMGTGHIDMFDKYSALGFKVDPYVRRKEQAEAEYLSNLKKKFGIIGENNKEIINNFVNDTVSKETKSLEKTSSKLYNYNNNNLYNKDIGITGYNTSSNPLSYSGYSNGNSGVNMGGVLHRETSNTPYTQHEYAIDRMINDSSNHHRTIAPPIHSDGSYFGKHFTDIEPMKVSSITGPLNNIKDSRSYGTKEATAEEIKNWLNTSNIVDYTKMSNDIRPLIQAHRLAIEASEKGLDTNPLWNRADELLKYISNGGNIHGVPKSNSEEDIQSAINARNKYLEMRNFYYRYEATEKTKGLEAGLNINSKFIEGLEGANDKLPNKGFLDIYKDFAARHNIKYTEQDAEKYYKRINDSLISNLSGVGTTARDNPQLYKDMLEMIGTLKANAEENKDTPDSAKLGINSFKNGGLIKKYHSGGYVDETGPAILQKGEYVLPSRFAEGGLALSSNNTLSNGSDPSLNGKSTVDLSNKIEFNMKDKLKVNLSDIIDIKSSKLSINVSDLISINSSDKIKVNLSDLLDITGDKKLINNKSVGADSVEPILDKFKEEFKNQIADMGKAARTYTDSSIKTMLGKGSTGNSENNINVRLGYLENQASNTIMQVGDVRSQVSSTGSSIRQLNHIIDGRFATINLKIDEINTRIFK